MAVIACRTAITWSRNLACEAWARTAEVHASWPLKMLKLLIQGWPLGVVGAATSWDVERLWLAAFRGDERCEWLSLHPSGLNCPRPHGWTSRVQDALLWEVNVKQAPTGRCIPLFRAASNYIAKPYAFGQSGSLCSLPGLRASSGRDELRGHLANLFVISDVCG